MNRIKKRQVELLAEQIMLVSEVAKRIGVTTDRIRQLDAELKPLRTASGYRIYLRDYVEEYIVVRNATAPGARGGVGRPPRPVSVMIDEGDDEEGC